jgi:hypothetical protein
MATALNACIIQYMLCYNGVVHTHNIDGHTNFGKIRGKRKYWIKLPVCLIRHLLHS